MRFNQKKEQKFTSFGCGAEHSLCFKGKCEACGRYVYSEHCDSRKCDSNHMDAPDPRGAIPENHCYARLRAREQGYSGRDVILCFSCSNDGEIYRNMLKSITSSGEWSKMEKGLYHISARRWFDGVNGNTYHSVVVTFPDGTSRLHGMTYGYGEHYLQTALEIMNGGTYPKHSNGNPKALWVWAQEQEIKYVVDCVDVQRKKDLHAS